MAVALAVADGLSLGFELFLRARHHGGNFGQTPRLAVLDRHWSGSFDLRAQVIDDRAGVHAGFDEFHRQGGEGVMVGEVADPVGRALSSLAPFVFARAFGFSFRA